MQVETLSHRPVIAMSLSDTEQPVQFERVRVAIEPLVLAWFEGQRPGDEFHINELTRYVWRTAPHIAADSPRRVMAALKADGKLNYELVNRSQSLYRVAAMEAALVMVGNANKVMNWTNQEGGR